MSRQLVLNEEEVARFFWYARERHLIWHRRTAGRTEPWTADPVMSKFRITNVFRELDKTTAWYRKHVREVYDGRPEVLLATVLFRWFNTIRSGETMFAQRDLLTGENAFETYLRTRDVRVLEEPLREQGAPWVTGSYMIRSPEGVDKLTGILDYFSRFSRQSAEFVYPSNEGRGHCTSKIEWREVADIMLDRVTTLQSAWWWVKQYEGLGPFLAYEIVTDLRHTKLLNRAPDVMTWANPGPGALRGAGLILNGAQRGRKGRLVKADVKDTHEVMKRLLELSRDPRYWPQVLGYSDRGLNSGDVWYEYTGPDHEGIGRFLDADSSWQTWEMREPEMWLCEFAKLERTRLGFGQPRGRFR